MNRERNHVREALAESTAAVIGDSERMISLCEMRGGERGNLFAVDQLEGQRSDDHTVVEQLNLAGRERCPLVGRDDDGEGHRAARRDA